MFERIITGTLQGFAAKPIDKHARKICKVTLQLVWLAREEEFNPEKVPAHLVSAYQDIRDRKHKSIGTTCKLTNNVSKIELRPIKKDDWEPIRCRADLGRVVFTVPPGKPKDDDKRVQCKLSVTIDRDEDSDLKDAAPVDEVEHFCFKRLRESIKWKAIPGPTKQTEMDLDAPAIEA